MSKLFDSNKYIECNCRFFTETYFESPGCLNKEAQSPWADLNIRFYKGHLGLKECPYSQPKTIWQKLWKYIEDKWR